MKFITSIIFLCALFSHAQKKIEKTIVLSEHISTVVFDLEQVFSINLKSSNKPTVNIIAISEGEYANHFVVIDNTKENVITVTGKVGFTFPNDQDKLSAHKVHAITLQVTVPEDLPIMINSDIGNLYATGNYNELTTNFMSGNCELLSVSGNLFIKTVNGDINLITKSGHVIPETKSGVITQKRLTKGSSVFKLKTIKGNINIEQSK